LFGSSDTDGIVRRALNDSNNRLYQLIENDMRISSKEISDNLIMTRQKILDIKTYMSHYNTSLYTRLDNQSSQVNNNIESSKALLEQKVLDLIRINTDQSLLFTQIGRKNDNHLTEKFNDLLININNRSSQVSQISGNIGELLGLVNAISRGLEESSNSVNLGNNLLENSIREGNGVVLDCLSLLGRKMDSTPQIHCLKTKRKEWIEFDDLPPIPIKRQGSKIFGCNRRAGIVVKKVKKKIRKNIISKPFIIYKLFFVLGCCFVCFYTISEVDLYLKLCIEHNYYFVFFEIPVKIIIGVFLMLYYL
jgi:hypothetical protein